MSDVLDRNSLPPIAPIPASPDFRVSVNPPDLPPGNWLEYPLDDLGNPLAITPYESRYWVLEPGDTVRDSTAPEKSAVDAAIVAADLLEAQQSAEQAMISDNDEITLSDRELLNRLTKTHNKLANRIREVERALEDMRVSTGGTANLRLAIPLPSAEVIAEGPAPPNFTNLQNRNISNEREDFQAEVLAGEANA